MGRGCEHKVAIVTGASRGIGASIARRLAEEGARASRSQRARSSPTRAMRARSSRQPTSIRAAGGEALPIQCDLSQSEDRHRLVTEVVEQFGPVDILVNNAAVTFLLPLEDFPEKRFKLMLEVQLWAPYELAQLVVPGMKRRGEGWILNISSRAATHPIGPPFEPVHTAGNFSAYGMVKAGLNRLTTALAAELYDNGIAVNSLAPWDNVATPGASHHDLVEDFALRARNSWPRPRSRCAPLRRSSSPGGSPSASRSSPSCNVRPDPEAPDMDFVYPPEAESFREDVRGWLRDYLVGDYQSLGTGTELGEDDWPLRMAWEREMGKGGWIGLSWPREFGGRGATLMETLVFAEEYARANGPTRVGTFGEGMLGPTLMRFGTDAQKDRFLGPILHGEEIWCQGFSEPGAGSDLAGLSTKARRDGGDWVLDGQKVWTSQAQLSDWIFVLARTDAEAPKHKGISFLLVPLDQPGIDVRPLVDMAGGRHFCEVFFDGARTAADLLVGDPGDGWRIAMATLGFERGTAFIGQLRRYAAEFDRVLEVARQRGALDDATTLPAGRRYLHRLGADALWPVPDDHVARRGHPAWTRGVDREAAVVPVASSTRRAGHGSAWPRGDAHSCPRTAARHRAQLPVRRGHTIYAGSSQVQRNVIGERILGLPREPSAG